MENKRERGGTYEEKTTNNILDLLMSKEVGLPSIFGILIGPR